MLVSVFVQFVLLTGGPGIDKPNRLVVRSVCVDSRLDVAVWIQRLPHGKQSVNVGVMKPKHRVERCNLWIFHVTISSYTIVNAVVDAFDVVRCLLETARPCAGECCVVRNKSEHLIHKGVDPKDL